MDTVHWDITLYFASIIIINFTLLSLLPPAEMYKKELLAARSRVLMLDNMHIAKKPKSKKVDKALSTIQRNFKKLEID